ncbi:MAG: DUF2808 domain-containing protein [Synechococcales bacterium]|nr:DUF2808 domain-containing protein [Synechococcales bacterium]
MQRFWKILSPSYRIIYLFGITLLGMISVLSVHAVTLRDGKTYFLKPPRLLSSTTSQDGSFIWGASYHFTIRVPEGADEPLHKIVIEQQTGLGRPRFNANDAAAFEGTKAQRGQAVAFTLVETSRDPMVLTATFDPPIPPGKTITIRLFPVRNPEVGGVYLYGVTAFPPGEKPHGQFLGFGRIHIYDRDRD